VDSTDRDDDQATGAGEMPPTPISRVTQATEVAMQIREGLVALGRAMWAQARDRKAADWPPWWLPLFAVLTAGAVLWLLVVPLLRGLVWWIGDRVADLAGWGHDQAYAQVVIDPVRGYLTDHAVGLPVDGTALWWTWCLAGGVLLSFSLLHSIGARIGWILYGVASAAMVAAGTSGPGRWIAAGVCGLWWSLLSIPALWQRRPRPLMVPAGPAPASATAPATTARPKYETPSVTDESPLDDDAAWAAGLYETLMRRDQVGVPSEQRWIATTHAANGFTAAADDGRQAAGIAISGEAVRELLAGLSTPAGARPQVEWTTAPPVVPPGRRMDYNEIQGPGSIREFVQGSAETLSQLAAVLHERHRQWPTDLVQIQEKIVSQEVVLNRAHPYVDASSYAPNAADRQNDLGHIALNDWIPTDTIVGGVTSSWNDFGSHRPEQVGLIIGKLLTAANPGRALAEILTDDGHVHLSRYPGPAGPIHKITVNGTHRSHALRLLAVPLIAAEVTVEPLPLRVDAFSTSDNGGWGENRHHGPTEALWRALMERGLLTGRIVGAGYGAVLESWQVTAPWLLGCPRDAAAISSAYERLHPGALGIPVEAMSGAAQWCQWLLGNPRPSP
jgi:hypothetical protein